MTIPNHSIQNGAMEFLEHVSLKGKTTMRIGGEARYYAEPATKEDVEAAWQFTQEKNLPLIVLGGGSNMIFQEGMIDALVIRIKADAVMIDGNTVTVESGKNLAILINELAAKGLDLSPLTGILGTVGGAVFGNAGQGAGGIWIDSFIQNVTVFIDGEWKMMAKNECDFRYRESWFKDQTSNEKRVTSNVPPIIWSVKLIAPERDPKEIRSEIECLLQWRIETQPHVKTAGSCFKSLPDGTPAWKLIDAAGLRGHKVGGIEVSPKHANFLINTGEGTFEDVVKVTGDIQKKIPEIAEIEMRLIGNNGSQVI